MKKAKCSMVKNDWPEANPEVATATEKAAGEGVEGGGAEGAQAEVLQDKQAERVPDFSLETREIAQHLYTVGMRAVTAKEKRRQFGWNRLTMQQQLFWCHVAVYHRTQLGAVQPQLFA